MAIVGGGPGGYEAALVAASLGATVTVVDRDGLGGSAVLTDCVPSKTLIATAEVMTSAMTSAELGVRMGDGTPPDGVVGVDLGRVNTRVKELAAKQSADIATRLEREGVELVHGHGRLDGYGRVLVDGAGTSLEADVVLISTGAHPRILPDAAPDGE